jgi:D-3-phosphoglycerate dehydrogenase
LLLLALQRNLTAYDRAMKEGVWAQDVTTPTVHRLRGQTLGLIGFGTIARLVAEKTQAFGMDVVASDPYVDRAEMADVGVDKTDFEGVLDVADAVSLHAPLVEETRGTMDAPAFERMKETAYLVNVARGGLVVEDDLVRALRADEIAGAGLDVFGVEPSSQGEEFPAFESPLREFENVVLTPHVAWFSREANDERRRTAAEDVRRVLEGETPENAVNDPL